MKNNYLKKDGYFFALIDFLNSPPFKFYYLYRAKKDGYIFGLRELFKTPPHRQKNKPR